MEKPEKSASKSEAESGRGFWFKRDRGIVQAKFFEGFFQIRVLVRVDRIDPTKNHRLRFFETSEGFLGGEIKNLDIVQEVCPLYRESQAELVWVRGHVGDEGNELADEWANKAREGARI